MMSQTEGRNSTESIGTGVAMGILAILVAQLPGFYFGVMWLFFFGVTQLLITVPLRMYLSKRGHWYEARGVGIIVGIGFLLNAICLVLLSIFPYHP